MERQTLELVLRRGCSVIALCSMMGCVGTHLYRQTDDQSAQAAYKAFVDSDLKNSLAAERTSLADFAKREQNVVRRDQISLRDRNLVAILAASDEKTSWDYFEGEIAKRLKILLGEPSTLPSTIGQQFETALKGMADAHAKFDPARQTYLLASKGKIALKCPVPSGQRPSVEEPVLQIAIQSFDSLCNQYLTEKKKIDDLAGTTSILGKANQQIHQIAEERGALEVSLAGAKSNYKNALTQIQQTSQTESGALESAAKSLKEKLDKLYQPLEKSSALAADRILSHLELVGAIEKLKSEKVAIDDLLTALAQPEQESVRPALTVAAALSSFEKAITTEKYPQVSSLLLQSEHLRLEVQALQRKVDRAEERVSLLQLKRSALIDEVVFLAQAQKALATSRGVCKRNQNLYDDYRAGGQNCKALIADALVGYSNSQTLGRARQELIDYQLLAQRHESLLDESETALAQTDNLIRVPLAQLSKLYASGIKPEDLANLIQAFGFSAIAINVK